MLLQTKRFRKIKQHENIVCPCRMAFCWAGGDAGDAAAPLTSSMSLLKLVTQLPAQAALCTRAEPLARNRVWRIRFLKRGCLQRRCFLGFHFLSIGYTSGARASSHKVERRSAAVAGCASATKQHVLLLRPARSLGTLLESNVSTRATKRSERIHG